MLLTEKSGSAAGEIKMKITLTNDFHNTSVVLRSRDGRLTGGQRDRAKRILCGITGCTCSDEWGMRGKQPDKLAIETTAPYGLRGDYVAHIIQY
jgi:hypothetical protein